MEPKAEEIVLGMQRRDFLKGAALGVLGMTSLGALSGCSPKEVSTSDESAGEKVVGEPAMEHTGMTGGLTLAEVNALRKEIIDSKTDYVCEDGTVIPAVYVKLRTLINSIGLGMGSDVSDTSFNQVMYNFSEEEAQAYLDMPRGVYFTATDFSAESGRDEDECLAVCEELSSRGLLFRVRRGGVPHFHLLAEAHGIWEYNMFQYTPEYITLHNTQWGKDFKENLYNSETPFYYAVPVSQEVVADEAILPYDDYEKIIARNTMLTVSPCQCRLNQNVQGTRSPDCIHPLETCIALGEEAEFYLENGIGRQITQQEALDILRHNVELGMVIQSAHSKSTEVICSCHGDCCDILRSYVALNGEIGNSMVNVSHYRLVHDKDACIKCGACVSRCPLFAISIDDEGYPAVDAKCIRCGQCGTVCPAHARTLVQKESYVELPDTMLDDYNVKSEYRIANGKVY